MDKLNMLVDIFKKHFDSRHYNVGLTNFNKVIVVEGKRNDTRIWVRLLRIDNGCIINFATVQLSQSIRRKGRFTALVKDVVNSGLVSKVVIGGVCTEAMRAWCDKNGFVDQDGYNEYILIDINKLGG